MDQTDRGTCAPLRIDASTITFAPRSSLVEAGDDVRYTVNNKRLPARLAAMKTVAEARGVADKLTM